MAIRDKTQPKSSKFTNKSPLQKNAHYNKSNPNYYPSVASVDSKKIESICIFPKILNRTHKRMCGKIQVNKVKS